MRILLIHTHYQQAGGEDAVVQQETDLLKEQYTLDTLFFQNKGGIKGALQFLISICNIRAAHKVKQKIKEFKPDVVHLHNWHFASGPWIIRTIKKKKIPIVATLHNYRLLCPSGILLHNNQLFLESLTESFPWTAIKKKVYRNSVLQTFWLAFIIWFHKKIGTWQMVDQFVCLTDFTKGLFKQSHLNIAEDKFFVKPNFVNAPTILNALQREKHFLFIGRLSEEKGIRMLLEVFEQLPYQLKIAGDGPLKELVIKATQSLSKITYIGSLSNENVIHELQKTQTLIFPSIWFEGMPMTILEAFSTGTPVIASNLGAMSSIIQDGVNGLHFKPGDINSLKSTLDKFCLLSAAQKTQMQYNALNTYETLYSPKKQIVYFEAIYAKAIKSNLQ